MVAYGRSEWRNKQSVEHCRSGHFSNKLGNTSDSFELDGSRLGRCLRCKQGSGDFDGSNGSQPVERHEYGEHSNAGTDNRDERATASQSKDRSIGQ